MSSIAEIEDAIRNLPMPEVDKLAAWLEEFRHRAASGTPVENWLMVARGAVRTGATTASIMALTRGDE